MKPKSPSIYKRRKGYNFPPSKEALKGYLPTDVEEKVRKSIKVKIGETREHFKSRCAWSLSYSFIKHWIVTDALGPIDDVILDEFQKAGYSLGYPSNSLFSELHLVPHNERGAKMLEKRRKEEAQDERIKVKKTRVSWRVSFKRLLKKARLGIKSCSKLWGR